MRNLGGVVLEGGSTGAASLPSSFGGAVKLRVDKAFQRFVATVGHKWRVDHLVVCSIVKTRTDIDGNVPGNVAWEIDPNIVWALLKWLGLGGQGAGLLEIPEGEEEVNLVLGYATIDGELRMFFINHEFGFEDGVEEYHLQARRPERLGDEDVLAVVFT